MQLKEKNENSICLVEIHLIRKIGGEMTFILREGFLYFRGKQCCFTLKTPLPSININFVYSPLYGLAKCLHMILNKCLLN